MARSRELREELLEELLEEPLIPCPEPPAAPLRLPAFELPDEPLMPPDCELPDDEPLIPLERLLPDDEPLIPESEPEPDALIPERLLSDCELRDDPVELLEPLTLELPPYPLPPEMLPERPPWFEPLDALRLEPDEPLDPDIPLWFGSFGRFDEELLFRLFRSFAISTSSFDC